MAGAISARSSKELKCERDTFAPAEPWIEAFLCSGFMIRQNAFLLFVAATGRIAWQESRQAPKKREASDS